MQLIHAYIQGLKNKFNRSFCNEDRVELRARNLTVTGELERTAFLVKRHLNKLIIGERGFKHAKSLGTLYLCLAWYSTSTSNRTGLIIYMYPYSQTNAVFTQLA